MRISDWSSDVCPSDLLFRKACRLVCLSHGRDASDHLLRDAWRAAVLRGRQRRATPDHPELADTHHSGACRSVLAWHGAGAVAGHRARSEEHTSELQSLMRISYAVFCLTKQINVTTI